MYKTTPALDSACADVIRMKTKTRLKDLYDKRACELKLLDTASNMMRGTGQ